MHRSEGLLNSQPALLTMVAYFAPLPTCEPGRVQVSCSNWLFSRRACPAAAVCVKAVPAGQGENRMPRVFVQFRQEYDIAE